MITEQIMATIDAIAERLGVAAEAVYPMLIKQAGVFAATYHVTLWILCVSAVLLIVGLVLTCIGCEKCWDSIPVWVGVIVVSVIALMAAGITALIDLNQYLTSVHNPDMWVVEYVAKLLG